MQKGTRLIYIYVMQGDVGDDSLEQNTYTYAFDVEYELW